MKKIDGNGTETIYVNRELEITRFAGGRLLSTEYIQDNAAMQSRLATLATGTFSWEGLGINFGIGLLAGAFGAGLAGGLAFATANLASKAAWAITRMVLQAAPAIVGAPAVLHRPAIAAYGKKFARAPFRIRTEPPTLLV